MKLREDKDKMKTKVMALIICFAVVGMMGSALAQQHESTVGATVGIAVPADELVVLAKGWSAKKQLIGKNVYNGENKKIGVVKDLIIAPDKAVSYAIIGTGGFLGMDKHDVAIRVSNFRLAEGKITLPGATKDALKAMPAFEYTKK